MDHVTARQTKDKVKGKLGPVRTPFENKLACLFLIWFAEHPVAIGAGDEEEPEGRRGAEE